MQQSLCPKEGERRCGSRFVGSVARGTQRSRRRHGVTLCYNVA